jgi:hypothetical protein
MSTASPFALTSEIKALVAGAFDSSNVLLLAAVGKDQKPVLSFRGSTAVFSDTQLSLWARNAEGGTIEAISNETVHNLGGLKPLYEMVAGPIAPRWYGPRGRFRSSPRSGP